MGQAASCRGGDGGGCSGSGTGVGAGAALGGRRVLVTGASGGLGRAAALRLAAAGARVAAWGRNAEALEALRQEVLRAAGEDGSAAPEVRLTTCDLGDPAAVERAAAELLDDWGGVDVLVNNAGVLGTPAALERKDPGEMSRVLSVNSLAPMLLARTLLPGMIAQGAGAIVSVSSAAGVMGCAGAADYCASKFALFGFMESLRLELRARGLLGRVVCVTICPGYIAHEMAPGAGTAPAAEPAAEGEGGGKKKAPPGGLLSLDEVARAVVDAAAGRTGAVVHLPRSLASVSAARALYPPSVCDRLFNAFSQLPPCDAVAAPA